MSVLHVCLICMPYMCAYVYALYVCLTCVPAVHVWYALHVCMVCVTCMPLMHASGEHSPRCMPYGNTGELRADVPCVTRFRNGNLTKTLKRNKNRKTQNIGDQG